MGFQYTDVVARRPDATCFGAVGSWEQMGRQGSLNECWHGGFLRMGAYGLPLNSFCA